MKRIGWKKERLCWCLLFFLVWTAVVWRSSAYIIQWQPSMLALIQLYDGLKEQGADSWLSDLIGDAKCFPVREQKGSMQSQGKVKESGRKGNRAWYFEDGYGDGRSYGGNRKHEGIDIMSADGERGSLEIVSVSEGTVEQLGWLELGGYRVGVRSKSGLYFYYAHMDRYASGLKKGDRVHPGTLLGYMGDTGYGKEGTKGKFPVHLHFGIYYDEDGEEKSLNPYFLLRVLEEIC